MIRDFLVSEIRKNLDLRKILVTPKIFLKSRFQCKRGKRGNKGTSRAGKERNRDGGKEATRE